ncbi:MAG: TetR/AcrR family transcriptional regulator [Candidatus Dormiibacterota bacterium]
MVISALDEGTVLQGVVVRLDEVGRRSQIVHAAARVLGRKGYGATSLKDVAREARVAPGLLHYYFESKEDLLLEVVSVMERQVIADWKAAIAGIEDPLERIVAGLDHAEARCAEQPEIYRLVLDLYTVSLSSPALRHRCAEVCSHLVDEIEMEVRRALGPLPAYALVAPRDLAGAIAGAIDGVALSSLVLEQPAAARFHALKVLLLSLVVTAYVTAGQEPPIARLGEMLSRHP